MSMISSAFAAKAESWKRPLKHQKVLPKGQVEMVKDPAGFQGLAAKPLKDLTLPLILQSGDSVILDFGDHAVGYLHFALNHLPVQITDSPVTLRFSFGEFPLEIITPPEEYRGGLGSGWLQNETKAVPFTPYTGSLERRYAFRYLKIQRTDTGEFPVAITELFADSVSAVSLADAPVVTLSDPALQKIYDISLKTLKECEQDVFEDGPKRDRRLWIGDLRLQALTDYHTFQNLDLIRRCLYLFAAYRTDKGYVAPCVFPDSPPFVDEWNFSDYSLFFVSCLLDYLTHTGDKELAEELYPVAAQQVALISADAHRLLTRADTFFIDWCRDLDKTVAAVGVWLYVLGQFETLSGLLGKACDVTEQVAAAKELLLSYYSAEKGLFVARSGQLSWHSQVWAVLSGVLSAEEAAALLDRTEKADPSFIMHTPYMMHYYLEALWRCGRKEQALSFIRDYWGQIAGFGFDCCPELFNPDNHLESPYDCPELNSGCHAWSCTPAYWLAPTKKA